MKENKTIVERQDKKEEKTRMSSFYRVPFSLFTERNANTKQDVEYKTKQTLNTRFIIGLKCTSLKYIGTLIDKSTWTG